MEKNIFVLNGFVTNGCNEPITFLVHIQLDTPLLRDRVVGRIVGLFAIVGHILVSGAILLVSCARPVDRDPLVTGDAVLDRLVLHGDRKG